jgi:hypothetical protein
MQAPVNALLSQIIDYAGLFPPAKLNMPESVANYVRYLSGTEAWIVNRFVCPASQLREFQAELAKNSIPEPVPVSVLGTGGPNLDTFESNLEADAKAMTSFDAECESALIDAFEIRLPATAHLDRVIRDLQAFDSVDVFLEVAPSDLDEALPAIAASEWLCAKFRSGSVVAAEVPSSESLAAFLKGCLDLDLPFKLTAGLHEPFRHMDDAVGADLHGFMNVLLGCLMHQRIELSTAEWVEILELRNEKVAQLDSESIDFRGEVFGMAEIEDLRSLFISIGSCSVLEPLQGLERMGWVNRS